MWGMFRGIGVAGSQRHLFNQDLGGWDVSSVPTMNGIFAFNYGMTEQNWSATLIGWDSQAVENGVTVTPPATGLTTEGTTARDNLINDHSWTFN